MSDQQSNQVLEGDLIRNIEGKRLRALVDGDIGLARQLHAPDFQLITPIGQSLSKDEYLGAIESGHIKYLAWEPGPIEVQCLAMQRSFDIKHSLSLFFRDIKFRPAPIGTQTPTKIAKDAGRLFGRKRLKSKPARKNRAR